MKKLTAQYRVIGGVFCLFFLNCIAQAQDDGTIITTSEDPVVVIDSYEAALDENTKQSDLNIGEAVEPDFFNDIVDRIRGIFTNDDGSIEIGFLSGVFKSDTPALRIDQEGDAILQGDLTVRTVKSAGDLTVGSPEEVSNTEGKAITVGDKDRGVIELHGGNGQDIIAKGIVQTGVFGMELGTLTNQVLKFFTNSTPRMSITTEGNVGIGETTTNPTARLEVGGDIKATDTITASSFIGDGSQLTGIEGKFTDGDTATDAVFTAGNVGIGTTDPSSNLHIKDETALVLIDASEGTASSGNAFLSLENDLGYRGNIAMGRSGLTNGGNNALTFRNDYSLGSLLFQTGGSVNRMAINSAGNVGIGTTSPGARLEVVDGGGTGNTTIAIRNTETNASYPGAQTALRLQHGSRNASGSYDDYAFFDSRHTERVRIGTTEAKDIRFNIGSLDGTKMTIKNSGNVGIGTTSPSSKLEIADSDYLDLAVNQTDSGVVRMGVTSGTATGFLFAGSNLKGVDPQLRFILEDDSKSYGYKEAMRIHSSGNVGIGTTDPTWKLTVSQPEGDYGIVVEDANGKPTIGFAGEPVFKRIWTESNGLNLGTHGGGTLDESKLHISDNGNVGIGTTDPLSYAGPNLDIQTGGLAINGQAITYYWPSSDTIGIGDVHSGDGLRDNLVLKTRDQDRLFINGSGNVGIGTTSPGAKLEVKSDSIKYSDVNATANSANAWNQHGLKVRSSNNSINFIASNTVNDRKAMIQAGHADSKYANYLSTLVINPFGGNVGIGTTSPSAKLDVNGEIRARGLIRFVDSTGSTQSDDYYFYKTNKGDGDNQLRLVIQDNSNERFEIWGNGCSTSGGCGANPVRSHYFQADGKAYHSNSVTATSFLYSSDENKKKNIQTLGSPLETIQNLRGVSFRWKESNEKSIGFIAQEVEKVLPSLVSGEEGEKSVAYGNLTAVLVEAVKQQQKQIAELRAALEELNSDKNS